ncbi:MAG: protein TolR [Nitrospiraceae bacterium]|jgi:biopolymer transport protein TolR|nr:MAG: protein TolR [Nitrospiraceae bacterium]
MEKLKHRQALSEINVTPFVDVMLVLLIIFMVTAPLLQQGIDINLPQAKGKEMPDAERIVITIKKDGKIYLEKTAVTLEALKVSLSKKTNKEVFLKADTNVAYGNVVAVMGELREMGIEKLGMVTEPKARIK